MIKQRDALWWRRLNGALRLSLVSGMLPGIGGYVVTEYPKSGGSWMAQMLGDALGLPFPRNRLPMIRKSILHGHYLPKHVGNPCITVWRDGRDVMSSLYHHRVMENDFSFQSVNASVRQSLAISEPANIRKYLPRFMEHVASGSTFPRYHWGKFVEQWANTKRSHIPIRYEDMLADSASELRKVSFYLGNPISAKRAAMIADRFSFSTLAGREPGTEDKKSYLRKGVAGDWRNTFSDEAKEVFKHFMGDALIEMGYETSHSW